jgi:hypothetical protein
MCKARPLGKLKGTIDRFVADPLGRCHHNLIDFREFSEDEI